MSFQHHVESVSAYDRDPLHRVTARRVDGARAAAETDAAVATARAPNSSILNPKSSFQTPGFQPFGFQSGLHDPDTGLVQFRARWYDPSTGRWLSKDPILLEGGLNLYAFCGNDPVNFTDPLGLLTWSQVGHFAAGMAIGAGIAAVVVVAAPAIASAGAAALVAAGMSAATAGTISTATVSGGLLIAGGYGFYTTGVNIHQNVIAGDWDAVAFDTGTLVGGVAVGVCGRPSGGRALAEGMMGGPSPAPNTWNPIRILAYEWANRYRPSMGPPGAKYFATSPTPASGGAAAAGIASGIGSSLYPLQSSDPHKSQPYK